MNLCTFLNMDNKCPVCGDPLHLFMQITDDELWEANTFNDSICKFTPIKTKFDDFIILKNNKNTIDIQFSSNYIFNFLKSKEMFFFSLCHKFGIECYLRTSSTVKFNHHTENVWSIDSVSDKYSDNFVRNEMFTFKELSDNGSEKIFILNFDFKFNKTRFKYYSFTSEEKKSNCFTPQILELDFPLLYDKFNFKMDQRKLLISKLKSWIILS